MALTVSLLALRCADAGVDRGAGFTVTDSSGVELVQNGRVGALRSELLALTEELRLGAADGPDFWQFYRIGPVRVDTAGSLHVPGNGSGELRIFSRDGSVMRSVGRRGGGPGEFQLISNVFVRGNQLCVGAETESRR